MGAILMLRLNYPTGVPWVGPPSHTLASVHHLSSSQVLTPTFRTRTRLAKPSTPSPVRRDAVTSRSLSRPTAVLAFYPAFGSCLASCDFELSHSTVPPPPRGDAKRLRDGPSLDHRTMVIIATSATILMTLLSLSAQSSRGFSQS